MITEVLKLVPVLRQIHTLYVYDINIPPFFLLLVILCNKSFPDKFTWCQMLIGMLRWRCSISGRLSLMHNLVITIDLNGLRSIMMFSDTCNYTTFVYSTSYIWKENNTTLSKIPAKNRTSKDKMDTLTHMESWPYRYRHSKKCGG